MSSLMTEPTVTTERAWGGQSMVAPLKRVLVRRPAAPEVEGHFADFGYPRAVDHDRTEWEHDAFRALLAEAGAEVVVAGPDETGLLDAIFAYDPSLMTDAGAVLLRPGKDLRLAEVDLAERSYAELGIPVIGRIEAPGTVEGGDTLWLDERTLVVGRGYRTNDEGIRQLGELIASRGGQVVPVALDGVLHLKSAVTALPDGTIVCADERLVDTEALPRVQVVPEEAGSHVVLLGEDRVLMAASAPRSAQLFREAGLDVTTVDISEFEKMEGCVTCLSVLVP